MTAFLDTNVLIRHLTGDPPSLGARATRLLGSDEDFLLPDLIVAECAYVLESFYRAPRTQVADALRAIVGFESIHVIDEAVLFRTIEVYETERLDFADAYLVACAEMSGVTRIASFDRALDRVPSVVRLDPA